MKSIALFRTTSPSISPTTATALAGAALCLLVALTFWPLLLAGFVWDDKAFWDAPPVAAWDGLRDIWLDPASLPFEAHYWPMLYSSFWLDHKIWGFDNPGGFHFTNILLHGVNAVLLWRLLSYMAVPAAWFIAVIFALHPVHVEAVAWVMSRKDLLGTLFYLLAVAYWLRFRQGIDDKSSRGRRSRRRKHSGQSSDMAHRAYVGMLACFVAGMLSKTFVITLPAALLIWIWWQQGHIRQRDFVHTLPLFIVGAFIAYIGLMFYFGRAEIDFHYSWPERIIIASKALWFYAEQLLWPLPLQVIYPHYDVNPALLTNWLYLPAALLLALGLFLTRHRIGRGPLAGALFFAVTLSPMLGFGNNSYMEYSFVADRYQYLAGMGLVTVLVAAVMHAYSKLQVLSDALKTAARTVMCGLAGACLAFYGYHSWQQTWVYQDEVALFSHVVAHNPTAHSAHYNLGIAFLEQERLAEAEAAYMQEISQDSSDPRYLDAISHLASVHFEQGDYDKARQLYQFSIDQNPDDADNHQNLGSSLAQLQRYEEAIRSFQRALEINPELHMARTNMETAQRMLAEQGSP